ncbi:uncharacterized protein LOC106648313 [Trichogramma pretiosum]|uniref:uncharacterized protein LOC106648313 n=1 Tax=Trichogramma pretiosum TaxID=7493 RepID=UPI0006C99F39|nr:uncharacterized protein LOC106648313 [Trichogramma pretiosum]
MTVYTKSLILLTVFSCFAWSMTMAQESPINVLKSMNSSNAKEAVQNAMSKFDTQGMNISDVIVEIRKYVIPFFKISLFLLDNLLRNTQNMSLPCIITSWIPLQAMCTSLKRH